MFNMSPKKAGRSLIKRNKKLIFFIKMSMQTLMAALFIIATNKK